MRLSAKQSGIILSVMEKYRVALPSSPALFNQRAEILLSGPAGPRHVPAQPLHFLLAEPQVDFDVSSGHASSFRLVIRVWGYPSKPMCRQSTMLAKKMPQAFSSRPSRFSAPDFSPGYTARL